MIKFAFIVAIVTNDGTMDMTGHYVEACPVKEEFIIEMEKLKSEGQFKHWDAVCVDLSEIGKDT